MLSIVMTAMTGLEPAQAAKRPQKSTMDLYQLTDFMPILAYGKLTANAGPVTPVWMSFPEGATIYLADSRNTCEGLYVYRACDEGRAYTIDSKYVTDIEDVKTIYNKCSTDTLTGTTEEVYQDGRGYESQKMTFEYNKDGTVCIVNGNGLYLDIQGGEAVSGAKLIFAPKSGSRSI